MPVVEGSHPRPASVQEESYPWNSDLLCFFLISSFLFRCFALMLRWLFSFFNSVCNRKYGVIGGTENGIHLRTGMCYICT